MNKDGKSVILVVDKDSVDVSKLAESAQPIVIKASLPVPDLTLPKMNRAGRRKMMFGGKGKGRLE